MQQGVISSVKLDDSVGSPPCWSSSASTVFKLDPEQGAASSSTITLDGSPESHKDFGVLTVPARLRDGPARQLDLGWRARFGLSLICTFVSANLYYCQPLLIEMANSFQQTLVLVAWIPTMYQAGYCVGLLFISPLGDLVRRRQLILALLFITTCLSVCLALARSFIVFCVLATLTGVFNVTPQILLPLAADFALPQHRARVISVLQSGIMLGILLARVLSGIIGYFTDWRTVYYAAVGAQAMILCAAYFLVPDPPAKNPQLTYVGMLRSMAMYAVREPRLVQAGLINVASVACWTNFWVTLTFLLGDDPYHFSTLWIGLFGLIGILGIFSAPLAARFIDKLGAWYSMLAATLGLLVLQAIETALGGINIAVVVIVCFGIDALRQTQTVSLQAIVFGISEEARSRLNAILTFSLFAGQVLGSSAGSHLFLLHGWRSAAALSVGLYGWQLIVLFMRGPNCGRHVWFGYQGGFAISGQKLCQEQAEAGADGANAGDGMETGLETEIGLETDTGKDGT